MPLETTQQMTLEQLIEGISRERIIPIVGSELCFIKDGTRTEPYRYLYEFLAEKLAGKFHLPYNNEQLHVVAAHKALQKVDVYTQVRDIYEDVEMGRYPQCEHIYDTFRSLANIKEFKIFLSVSFADYLQKALSEVRGADNIQVIDFSLSPASKEGNAPVIQEIQEGKTVVINLLGSIKAAPRQYALSEEEYLEYFFHIISGAKGEFAMSTTLLNKINNGSFLYLGCSFPVWYARYIVRGITQKRYTDHKFMGNIVIDQYTDSIPVINDFFKEFYFDILDDKKMSDFFGHINPGYILTGKNRADTFIQTLSNAIRSGHHTKPIYEGKVFISYYGRDKQQAEIINARLKTQGIDTWFDTTDLAAGMHTPEIQEKLGACRVFLPIISNSLIAELEKVEKSREEAKTDPAKQVLEPPYSVSVEWENIRERLRMEAYLQKTKRADSITPFVISGCTLDNIDKKHALIPDYIKAQQIYAYPDQLDKLIQDIKNYLSQANEKAA